VSPLQHGMLFHHVSAPDSGVDIEQIICALPGSLNLATFRLAWDSVIARHAILRTAFQWEGLEKPQQRVHPTVVFSVAEADWSSGARLNRTGPSSFSATAALVLF